MQINGIIESIKETQVISDKFSKREFVLKTEHKTQYPQSILMEFTQDKCGLLDKYTEGQEVSVDFNLRGRNWTNPQGEVKTFNTLQAWKIEDVNAVKTQTENTNTAPPPVNIPEPQPNVTDDDLPF